MKTHGAYPVVWLFQETISNASLTMQSPFRVRSSSLSSTCTIWSICGSSPLITDLSLLVQISLKGKNVVNKKMGQEEPNDKDSLSVVKCTSLCFTADLRARPNKFTPSPPFLGRVNAKHLAPDHMSPRNFSTACLIFQYSLSLVGQQAESVVVSFCQSLTSNYLSGQAGVDPTTTTKESLNAPQLT